MPWARIPSPGSLGELGAMRGEWSGGEDHYSYIGLQSTGSFPEKLPPVITCNERVPSIYLTEQ